MSLFKEISEAMQGMHAESVELTEAKHKWKVKIDDKIHGGEWEVEAATEKGALSSVYRQMRLAKHAQNDLRNRRSVTVTKVGTNESVELDEATVSVYKPMSASPGKTVSNKVQVKSFKDRNAMGAFLSKGSNGLSWKETGVSGLKSGKYKLNMVRGKDGKPAREFIKEYADRAAWVPESIADEQVEAFMEAALDAVSEGDESFVFEGKSYKVKGKKEGMDKVNPKALNKDFDDREDKDIDNDGDEDESDEYLHNRRKSVKKAMKDDDESMDENKRPEKQSEKEKERLRKKAVKAYKDIKKGKYPGVRMANEENELDEAFKVGDKVKVKKGILKGPGERKYEIKVGTIVKDYKDGDFKVNFGGNDDLGIEGKFLVKESIDEAAVKQPDSHNPPADTIKKQVGKGRTPEEDKLLKDHPVESEDENDGEKVAAKSVDNADGGSKKGPLRRGDRDVGASKSPESLNKAIADAYAKVRAKK